jgi:hypothetical protein
VHKSFGCCRRQLVVVVGFQGEPCSRVWVGYLLKEGRAGRQAMSEIRSSLPTRSGWPKIVALGVVVTCAVCAIFSQLDAGSSSLSSNRQLRESRQEDGIIQSISEFSRRLTGISEGAAKAEYLGFFRDALLNIHYNYHADFKDGARWPPESQAVSMAGQRRLDNFAALTAMVIEDGIDGHIIETGVWRGGASFMAAKTVELLGESSKKRVYLADSFQGIPPAPKDREYHWEDTNANTLSILNDNSPKRVVEDAAKFGLDMNHLRWVVGYFNESIPKLVSEEPDVRFSVVRLDGDTYFSTMDAIRYLYPRLNPGGFLIIDDFTDWTGCMNAIRHYRKKHDIVEPKVIRGVYWRKGPLKEGMSLCSAPAKPESLRPKGSYNPARLVEMPHGGPPGIGVGLIKIFGIPNIMMCVD